MTVTAKLLTVRENDVGGRRTLWRMFIRLNTVR